MIGGREFRLMCSPSMTLVFPKPSRHEQKGIKVAIRSLGLYASDFFYPETEEEFESMLGAKEEAESWYHNLKGFLP